VRAGAAAAQQAHDGAPPVRRVKFYRAPMNPMQTSPVPQKDEMGMDYVPVYQEEPLGVGPGPSGYSPLQIDPQRQQLLGLKTTAAKIETIAGTLRTVGRVTFDETRIHHVHTRFEAYVEQVYADFTGKYVRKGEPLVSLYSPDLLAAEQEYLIALRAQAGGSPPDRTGVNLAQSARQKLLLWNIEERDIAALEQSGQPSYTLRLYAPISGYVTAKLAVHGMRIKPEDSLFDLVDLSRIWVLADIYEYELPRLRLGQQATITLAYWPNRSWAGRITYIYPSVDPKTRTVKVRLDVENPQNDLKAEMYANVEIAVAPHPALVVPEEAVLETGTRKLVFVALGEGKLEPREVQTGERANRLYELKSGLKEGERVALGAAFLLDSESRLQAVITEMSTSAPQAAPAPQAAAEAGAAAGAPPPAAQKPAEGTPGGTP
jgi:Cu(I)/Ag(I) efflux system membrane fusion protein